MYKILKNLATCALHEDVFEEFNGWVIVDARDLIDGEGNKVTPIQEKIRLIAHLLSDGFQVCVRCAAGISRSNTIACAVIVYVFFDDWDDAWKKVSDACPRAQANMRLVDTVKQALLGMGVAKKRLYYD